MTGGAIVGKICAVKMVNTRFSQNTAVDYGGAVDIYGFSKLTAHNCSFTDNFAHTGGAIRITYSESNISESNFSHNLATDGNAAELIHGSLIMANCHMSNNSASGNGGVILAQNGTLLMSSCLVYNNTANGNGGVVKSRGSEIVITTSIFKLNTTLGGGGVFYVEEGTMLLREFIICKKLW